MSYYDKIHDKTDDPLWSDSIVAWDDEFDHQDIVISQDPQDRLGEETYSVSYINLNAEHDYVRGLGLFWHEKEAFAFAESCTMKTRSQVEGQLSEVELIQENDNDERYQATLNGQAIALKWVLDND
jgi:hypothetical protein